MPGKKPAVCHSLVELLDLYPTTASICGLSGPENNQGKDISALFDDPTKTVRDYAVCGALLRSERWAYIYNKSNGELYDMQKDPKQYTNLFKNPEYDKILTMMQSAYAKRKGEIQNCDLKDDPDVVRGKQKKGK